MRRSLGILIALSAFGAAALRAQTDTTALPTGGDRVFLLPTANPIPAGHGFVADYELLFFYGGVGIGDVASLTAGLTLVPGVPFSTQLGTAQAKFTLAQSEDLSLAAGASLSFLTGANRYVHLFGVGSLRLDSVWYTAAIFYRVSGPDVGYVNAGQLGSFSYVYTGGLGVALGLEAPVARRGDVHLLAELWNHDVSDPRHTALMGGFRIGNEILAGCFGLAIVPVPYIVPVAQFSYRW